MSDTAHSLVFLIVKTIPNFSVLPFSLDLSLLQLKSVTVILMARVGIEPETQ